jgi:hypothetical protein
MRDKHVRVHYGEIVDACIDLRYQVQQPRIDLMEIKADLKKIDWALFNVSVNQMLHSHIQLTDELMKEKGFAAMLSEYELEYTNE